MQRTGEIGFWEVVLKASIVHTATYFLVGISAFYLFNYAEGFASGINSAVMRPVSDPLVMAGPLFQPLRGALFGAVIYLLRGSIFTRKNGWLVLWATLAITGILNTFGPAPGSIEGAVYTLWSFPSLYNPSMLEVYGQSLLLASGVFYWVNYPANRWLGFGFLGIATLAIAGSLAGLLLAPPTV